MLCALQTASAETHRRATIESVYSSMYRPVYSQDRLVLLARRDCFQRPLFDVEHRPQARATRRHEDSLPQGKWIPCHRVAAQSPMDLVKVLAAAALLSKPVPQGTPEQAIELQMHLPQNQIGSGCQKSISNHFLQDRGIEYPPYELPEEPLNRQHRRSSKPPMETLQEKQIRCCRSMNQNRSKASAAPMDSVKMNLTGYSLRGSLKASRVAWKRMDQLVVQDLLLSRPVLIPHERLS